MGAVNDSWTVTQLQAECKRRGILGYSRLNKAALIRALNTGEGDVTTGNGGSTTGGGSTGGKNPTKLSVVELREECRRRGLKSYTKLTKAELIGLLKGASADIRPTISTCREREDGPPREPTLEELRAECRRRGMTGFSHLKKNELVRRMEDYESPDNSKGKPNTTRSLTRGRKVVRMLLRAGGKDRELQKQQSARKRGPLRSRAQERFDSGPSSQDTPGFLYIYHESDGGGGGGVNQSITDWKIGKTILDPPERRMKQSAQNNRKEYKLRASWYVPWCGYVEKIVHLDLDDFNVVPGKEKDWEGGGREDGGTEWFRTDIGIIEARVKLVMRMVAAREADEAESLGVPAFCGVFRCGLPTRSRRRRQREPQLATV
ncbi:unnamed protein product [Pylaiella littoralis]